MLVDTDILMVTAKCHSGLCTNISLNIPGVKFSSSVIGHSSVVRVAPNYSKNKFDPIFQFCLGDKLQLAGWSHHQARFTSAKDLGRNL